MSQVTLVQKFLTDQSSVTEQELVDNAALTVPTTNTNSPEFYAGVVSEMAVGCLKNEPDGISKPVSKQIDYWIVKYYESLEV